MKECNFKHVNVVFGIIGLLLFGAVSLRAHSWMAPKDAALHKNPVAGTRHSLAIGEDVYIQFCADCHGVRAQGLSKEITGLSVKTPDLRKRLQSHTQGDFYWKIERGRGDMPSFKVDLTEEEIWSTILHIDSLSKMSKKTKE